MKYTPDAQNNLKFRLKGKYDSPNRDIDATRNSLASEASSLQASVLVGRIALFVIPSLFQRHSGSIDGRELRPGPQGPEPIELR